MLHVVQDAGPTAAVRTSASRSRRHDPRTAAARAVARVSSGPRSSHASASSPPRHPGRASPGARPATSASYRSTTAAFTVPVSGSNRCTSSEDVGRQPFALDAARESDPRELSDRGLRIAGSTCGCDCGLRLHVERDEEFTVTDTAFGPHDGAGPEARRTPARSGLAPLRHAIGITGEHRVSKLSLRKRRLNPQDSGGIRECGARKRLRNARRAGRARARLPTRRGPTSRSEVVDAARGGNMCRSESKRAACAISRAPPAATSMRARRGWSGSRRT